MKTLSITLIVFLCAIILNAQPPQAFKYQAVVRNNTGEILQNHDVGIRISIHETTAGGTIVYQEIFSEITNDFGLVNLEIGNGIPTIGTFTGIDWGSNSKFLEIEIDPIGGTAYISMGTSELLSVPYALYSETSGNTGIWGKNADTIYYNEGNVGIGTTSPQGEFQVNDHFTWAGVNFNGTGQNDILVDGTYSGTGKTYYIVEVTEVTNDRDFFKWSDDNGAIWEENVEMDHSDIDLSYGMSIGFEDLDGHTVGDQWLWMMSENSKVFIVKNGTLGIGTPNIDPSAILDMRSTEKGMLIPRMTQVEIATIENPASGLQAFNTDNEKLYIYVLGDHEWKEVQYGSGIISSEASYTIGTGGACANTTVNGTYAEGVALNSSNTVTIDVMVTSIGNWEISTNTVNAYGFSGSGAFTSTGTIQVTLNGSGTPINAQTDSFAAMANNGGGNCTFDVSVLATDYTIGTGGSCTNTIVNGGYYGGVPLDGSNTVSLEATVTSPGPWSISTNGANGFLFSGSGIFTTTGTVQVTLNGTGTPTYPQTTNFTATANDDNGNCTFSVSVQQPFVCGASFTYEGQSYSTVQIGAQCWMAENLNIGTMISGSNSSTNNGIIEKYCYLNNTTNCNTYGGLYRWYEMMQYVTTEGTQGICPTNWHIPTDTEWCTLENEVDAGTVSCSATGWRGTDAGGNLKEAGTTRWKSPNIGATNSSGFTGLPGGDYRGTNGTFSDLTSDAYFWSSSEYGSDAWVRHLGNEDADVRRYNSYKSYGFSVRCVKD